jgi:hypothetical protein
MVQWDTIYRYTILPGNATFTSRNMYLSFDISQFWGRIRGSERKPPPPFYAVTSYITRMESIFDIRLHNNTWEQLWNTTTQLRQKYPIFSNIIRIPSVNAYAQEKQPFYIASVQHLCNTVNNYWCAKLLNPGGRYILHAIKNLAFYP